jgi:hypothetical protein
VFINVLNNEDIQVCWAITHDSDSNLYQWFVMVVRKARTYLKNAIF